MPRPGPRPYECVRRSWHSDRHQPIRGSVIQQIFRVVHENHSAGTKKNREWQHKLPLVVFKSEAIMYSKANSEAEYIDPDTLWDRLNDAINTIIRKDESLETGEFLPPCVEAALNLGCVPVRTSRSERNSNTRNYLVSRNPDSASTPPKTTTTAAVTTTTTKPNVMNQTVTTERDTRQNYKITPPGPSFHPLSTSLPTSSAYPLYYGSRFQPLPPLIIGTPVFQTPHDPLPPYLPPSFSRDDQSLKRTAHECDLSLRLGLGSAPVNNVDSGPSGSTGGSQNKEFAFFPLNSEAEQVADVRKRGRCWMQL